MPSLALREISVSPFAWGAGAWPDLSLWVAMGQ